MTEPIRIRFCPNCNTGIQEGLAVCPECGASQGREASRPTSTPEGTPEGMPPQGGPIPTQKDLSGFLLRAFLGPHLGCLATLLVLLFGASLFVGLLVREPMAVLGGLLLVVGGAGLALTAFLVRLLWDTRPPKDL